MKKGNAAALTKKAAAPAAATKPTAAKAPGKSSAFSAIKGGFGKIAAAGKTKGARAGKAAALALGFASAVGTTACGGGDTYEYHDHYEAGPSGPAYQPPAPPPLRTFAVDCDDGYFVETEYTDGSYEECVEHSVYCMEAQGFDYVANYSAYGYEDIVFYDSIGDQSPTYPAEWCVPYEVNPRDCTAIYPEVKEVYIEQATCQIVTPAPGR